MWAPKTLIPDYIKYGKDIVPSSGTSAGSGEGVFGSLFGKTFDSMNAISPGLVPIFLILLFLILGIVVLHMIIDKKPDAKKKK